MRLKKIKLFGFKSFADHTTLEFNEGITGVVGPNGCGKSNIADAFRWVLGEQSAKSMRGHKMNDVIFAGTSTRKPLNFAEVTIVLDNSDGSLPIEYAEVAVTRRLHRSGESEYFLNGHNVRLKDVQSLLLDSGMGKDAYSIFEQGKIDQVINYTPIERRHIFEEASGILRFLQRKREALRKLEQSDQNLTRVKDIHSEVEKQIVILEQQAEKARVFKEQRQQLELLEKGVFVAKHDHLERRCQETFKKDDQHKLLYQEANAGMDQLKNDLLAAKASLEESEMILRKQSEEVYRTRSEKEIKMREKLSNQERLKEAVLKEKRWQNELESMLEKRQLRQTEKSMLLKQQKELEKRLQQMTSTSQSQREKVKGMEQDLAALREQYHLAQQKLMKLLQAENEIESEFKQNNVRRENNQERLDHLLMRQQRLQELIKELSAQVKEKKIALDEVSEKVDAQRELLTSQENTLLEVNQTINQLQGSFDSLQTELAESRARQSVLLRLRDELEGFSQGSKRLLQESSNPKSPFYKKIQGLYEYLAPQEGSEKALAQVMKPYAQTLVVQTEDDLKEVMDFAAKHKLKDFSIFCLENLSQFQQKAHSSLPSGIKDLARFVSTNENVKHFLQNSFMAESHALAKDWAKNNPGASIWVTDGSYIDRHQVFFSLSQGENNVFLREAELKGLEKKIEEKEQGRSALESKLKTLQGQRNQLQMEKSELDKSIRREEMKLVEVNFALQRTQGDLDKAQNETRQIESEKKAIEAASEQLALLLQELELKRGDAKAKLTAEQKLSATLNQDVEQKLGILKAAQQEFQEKEAELQNAAEENRKAIHQLNVLDVKDAESEQQEERLLEEIENSRELQSQIKQRTEEFEHLLGQTEISLKEVMTILTTKEQVVVERKKNIEAIEDKISKQREKLKLQETELNQIAIQLAQIESSRLALETELQERYRLTIQDAKALQITLEKTLEQTEKQIRAIRQEMEAAGDINMTSIEEFDKYKARYEFLNQQMDDLNVSKDELLQIITQLDGESRKIFKETFEIIRNNFKKNFKILFNGGEADLQFTETNDVLEAGIEIIAKPPGKQMRSINLLSGGEKCLTALALLFAIFEVKPAPFCILDEIDAPLDDTNVERFVNVVKQFIEKCQFIIITHNKITMSIADVLFGVSMQEKGVSKLLSIEFTNHSTPEPAFVEG